MRSLLNECLGELAGTFMVVFLGCGAVAVSLLFNGLPHITAIAAVWGIAVITAIYLFRSVCGAHFNPAVSIAMVIAGRFEKRKLVGYFMAQLAGAMVAAGMLYLLLKGSLTTYENTHDIVRGTPGSAASARMFGEFYAPNPVLLAMLAECAGTFLLTTGIFIITHAQPGKKSRLTYAPVAIGILLALLICVFASVTQAGFNPARDFGPRCIAFLCGWQAAAFPDQTGGFFWVYILAPFMGAAMAAVLYNYYRRWSLGTALKMKYENG
ncbi:aquaporin family protein [Niabella pedocola]|uniref:Aquaporin family protein n=1 Tax=Niabella pedocola TaxID=1752077 RepID=A0ABS8PWC5_9BACT|nr:MIP/aquaporin family protein [Niabella pedocola]MCD2425373.1 aquaporin family protein [Niabella pedocola]